MTPFVTETFFEMDDGVRLYTRIVAPAPAGRFPIVLIRTPYEQPRHGIAARGEEFESNLFVSHGYALITQHCRGSGDSEGFFTPYSVRERMDSLKTLELIRALPLYNEEIYPFGGSYLAQVHYLYLNTHPADIKGAVLAIQTDNMYFRNFRNGNCYAFSNLPWWAMVLRRQYPNLTTENIVQRPFAEISKRMTGEAVQILDDMLTHDTNDDFWASIPMTGVLGTLDIPTLFIEGWYDYYSEGMFAGWKSLPEETRSRSAMMVLPCGHATAPDGKSEYPIPHGALPEDYAVRWFDSLREKSVYPYAPCGQITYYQMGEDAWRTSPYPAPDVSPLRLYPTSCGELSSAPASGSLSFAYDPHHLHNFFRYGNPLKHPEARPEDGILSFYSAPFEQDTEFFGPVRWHAEVESDCEDTCFFMRVYLVENGESYNLTETLSTLRWQNPGYAPHSKATLDLLTPPMGFTVKKGCSLRLDISSDSTIYAPHANVAGHWAYVTETRVAHNTLYFSEDFFIELPKRS